ncbi:hypothetical protein SB768_25435 [Burkholderia sp. SIMBA_043]|uniref:hypothetical protein n=1 Tax=Burkholderia TaxID=32008 RepID=UPI0005DA393D|nr:hypothetical protein [Burkholderia vietnamiensis]AJY05891.1 hypothetical protein AK36_1423 [Burkholderia vietnamiensis LMG 10929]UBI25307.1 hypothetical protein LA325_18470 [Burkholderia vietnamiensis]
MKRRLSIPKGPKQQLFLTYLNAEFAKRTHRAQAHFENVKPDSILSVVRTTFGGAVSQAELIWSLRTSADGTLAELEVCPASTNDEAGNEAWEELAREIIDSALTHAFIESRRTEHRRQVFFYVGPQLDGEYWFRGVRVAPAILDIDSPMLINAERAVVLEFEVEAVDMFDASYLAAEFSRRFAARLSVLLDIDLYEHSFEQVWVMAGTPPVAERLGRGIGQLTGGNFMPKKGEICAAGAFSKGIRHYGRVAGTLKMPPEARRILRGVDALPEPVKDAFDGAARMYQIGLSLGRRFPSAELAYRVGAIEALSATDSEARSFSAFMRKHLSLESSDEQLLEYLYGDIRSSHFHSGKFDLGEFSVQRHMDIVSTPQTEIRRQQRYRCFELTRQAIVNWMLSNAAEAKA